MRESLEWLARSALLVLWTLVTWGGLLLLLLLGHALTEGLRPAMAQLLPSPGTSAWGWLNALSAGLALAVALAAAGVWVWGRRARGDSSSGRPGE